MRSNRIIYIFYIPFVQLELGSIFFSGLYICSYDFCKCGTKKKEIIAATHTISLHSLCVPYIRQCAPSDEKNVHWNKIEKKINSAALIRMEWIHKYINVEFHHQTSSMVHRNP